MQPFHWADHERWDWFGAGDPDVAPKAARKPVDANSAVQVWFETGLIFLVPLALAALIEIVLGI